MRFTAGLFGVMLRATQADSERTASACLLDVRSEFDPALVVLEDCMPQYLIERNIPWAGKLSVAELKAISQKSCGVLNQMGPLIQWVHSYVTGDQIYCVYRAPNEEMVREHARQGGFPVNRVSEIATTIDPTTAE